MTADESCDVLIVGAGPTGLMLANWLVKLGVDVSRPAAWRSTTSSGSARA
jgi:NADPH-dependent 2,4-dienoyl-CoA reductase/sulfur reductase-like enzyme